MGSQINWISARRSRTHRLVIRKWGETAFKIWKIANRVSTSKASKKRGSKTKKQPEETLQSTNRRTSRKIELVDHKKSGKTTTLANNNIREITRYRKEGCRQQGAQRSVGKKDRAIAEVPD